MAKSMALVALSLLSVSNILPSALAASSCIASDINWNLLAFNLGGKDYNAGTKDTWGSGTAQEISADGRPPFDTNQLTCYFSQFTNAVYFIGADSKNPSSVAIFDATANHWSEQAFTNNKFDPTSFVTILDHDTDVFYALSHGELVALGMNNQKTGNLTTAIAWEDFGAPPYDTNNYQPVMGHANNRVYFLNVPGVAAGTADIFVIHFAQFSPTPQAYGDIPATHGQTASVFLPDTIQNEFVFVPDDGSQTYVIDTINNSSQKLTGPPAKDSGATYFAMPDSILQLSSTGSVAFLPYDASNKQANQAATWSTVQNLASFAGSSSSGSSSGSSSSGSAAPAGTGSTTGSTGGSKTSAPSSPTSTGGSSSGNTTSSGSGGSGSGAVRTGMEVALGLTMASLIGALALMA